jgi:NTE family protein
VRTLSLEPHNVPADPDASDPSIGVCLSGGGFRASFFGLGVLRYLAEANRLRDVVSVSAVSGGSITAAVLADRWRELEEGSYGDAVFLKAVVEPMSAVVGKYNLRNRGLARGAALSLPAGRERSGNGIGLTLTKHLLQVEYVADFPRGVQIVLNTTDLSSGRSFRVSQDFLGGWDFGYAQTPDEFPAATAIGASTAVPFLFPPVPLRTKGLGLSERSPETLSLVDGGVYDNLGLEWFQGWSSGRPPEARRPNFLIVVDGSSPLTLHPARYGWLRSLRRSQEIQYAQSRASRTRWYVDHLLSGRLRGIHVPITRDARSFEPPPGIEFEQASVDAALPVGFAVPLSGLRTDVDRFLPDELALLMYHGYWATHVRLRHLYPHLSVASPGWRDYADVNDGEVMRLTQALEVGARRSPRRRSR